ncbi:hypothetical protein Q7P37_002799 [Cladosporium fusiforme]
MADEPFTLIEETINTSPHHLFNNVVDLSAARTADHDLQYVAALRDANPEMIVTSIPASNVNLRSFAASGHATCELDTKTDSFASWRGYIAPAVRSDKGQLGEQIHFAKYHYKWSNEDFILYTAGNVQYVLKERQSSEQALGPSHITDKLILTIGNWQDASLNQTVLVYDGYWQRSRELWLAVQKANWDKVILDEKMKSELSAVTGKFFDSKAVYDDLGVPWKRGLIFGGPPGNGKTISIKALMHALLFDRKHPIPTLYVRDAHYNYHIRNVFTMARRLAPCMLVLEDIETIVTPQTRSYFFNEMDGLENNDGLFIVASTNFLDRLDPGLSKRPSRFDRKYIFPIPNEHERTLYCEFWRRKLSHKPQIEFPEKLCPAMAKITDGFSFAFLQECFVATLLALAHDEDADDWQALQPHICLEDDDLGQYVLWRKFKEQADALRKQIEDGGDGSSFGLQDLHVCQPVNPQAFEPQAMEPNQYAGGMAEPGMFPELPPGTGKARVINSSAFALV